MNNKCDANKLKKLLMSLPVNYPIGLIYLNGLPIEISTLIFLNCDTGIANFVGAEGNVVSLDTAQINGLSFRQAEEPEKGCY